MVSFDFVSGKKEIQLNFLEKVKVFFGRIMGGVESLANHADDACFHTRRQTKRSRNYRFVRLGVGLKI
jgi:cystathionine beta-lyase/cystathionine gamma-synthase